MDVKPFRNLTNDIALQPMKSHIYSSGVFAYVNIIRCARINIRNRENINKTFMYIVQLTILELKLIGQCNINTGTII